MKLNSTDIRSVKINEPKYAGLINFPSVNTPQKLLDIDLPLDEGVLIYGPASNGIYYTIDGLTASGITGATFGALSPFTNITPNVVFIETNNLNKVNIRLVASSIPGTSSSGFVGILAN